MKKPTKTVRRKKSASKASAKTKARPSPITRAKPRTRRAPKTPDVTRPYEAEEFFRRTFELAPVGAAIVGPDFSFKKVNDSLCRFLGYTETELIGKHFPDITHPGDIDTGRQGIQELLAGKSTSFDQEKRYIRKDGAVVWGRVSVSIVRDKNDQPLYLVPIIQDINSRKGAEAALQESEKRFQQITKAVTDYVYTVHVVDGRAADTVHGPGCLAVTGYRPEEFTDDPFLWYRMVAPTDRALVEQQAWHILLGQEPAPIEHRIIHKNGIEHWVRNTFVLHHDIAGALTSYEGLIQDITERKQAEEALRVSEFRWKFAIEGAGDGLWDWDGTTNTVYYSRRWKEMLGYTDDEIENSLDAWEKLIHPDDKPRALAAAEAHRDGRTPTYEIEHRLRCKDGGWKWIHAHGTAVICDATGKPLRVIGRHTDISEQKRTKEAMEFSEALFRGTFDEAPMSTAIVGLDHVFQRVNAALCRLLGYTAEELQGKKFAQFTHPEDVSKSVDQAQRMLNGEYASISFEKRYLHKTGNVIWGKVSASLIRDGAGRPLHLVTSIQDITEQKQAEKILRETRAILQVALDQSPAGIAIADAPSGALRYVNDAALLMRGGDRSEIVNGVGIDQYVASWQLLDLNGTPLKTDEVPLARAIMRGEASSREFIIRRADGDERTVLANAAPTKDENGKTIAGVVVFLDISERKQAEANLAQFFELVPDMVCIASAEGFFVSLNDAWERVLGYSKAELMAVPFAEFIHPDDRDATLKESACQHTGKAADNFTNRFREKNGTYHWFEWNASAANEKGFVFAAARDITDHKLAEEAIRESELRYRTLANSGQGLIWTSGLDKKCNYFNQTWLAFTGRSLEQELGDGWVEGVHPDDLAYCVETYVNAFDRRERFSMDYRIRRHDGEYRWIQDDGSPRYDSQDNFLGYIGHCLDITDRKRADEALRLSERESRSLAESMPQIVWITRADGGNIYFNQQWVDYTGMTLEESYGDGWNKPFHPDDRQRAWTAWQNATQNNGTYSLECRLRRFDGTYRWWLVRGVPQRDEDGTILKWFGTCTDIEEIKQAEAALRNSEIRYRGLFDLAVDGILIGSAKGICIEINRQLCILVGRTRDELLGKEIDVLFAPEVLRDTPLRWDLLQQGLPVKSARPIKRPDGLEIIAEMHSKMMPDGTYQVFFHDVTAQTRAETALRSSEERFKNLFQQIPSVAIQGYAADGTTQYWNRASEELYGFTEQEAIGKSLLDLIIPPEMRPSVSEAVQHMITTGHAIPPGELSLMRKNGSLVSVYSSHAVMQQPGRTPELFCIDIDLTERKQAEAALRESEEKFAKVFHDAPVWIAITDLTTGKYIDVNEEALRVSGFTRQEATQYTATELGWISAENRAYLVEQLKTNGQLPGMEMAFRAKDGKILYGWFKGEKVVLSGRPCLLTVTIDITDRKRAEQALLRQAKDHAAELEQRVQERTAELEATNKELEAFSYSVSHDLRAPLRAIDGFSNILNTDFMARLDQEGQRVLGIICAEAKRMGLLIDDLLTFSRMNRLPMQTGAIDMAALAQDVFDECKPQAPGRQLQFLLQPLPTAQGDLPMIRQVLMNLISNAIKYTRPKAIAEIEIGGRKEGSETVYFIRDNGVGFDQRYADKLFGVFQRLHTEDEFEGTGVGLALVQRVIHRHGGRAWAEAKVNEGATFWFTLPMKNGE